MVMRERRDGVMKGCVKSVERRMRVQGKDGGRSSDERSERGDGESEQG